MWEIIKKAPSVCEDVKLNSRCFSELFGTFSSCQYGNAATQGRDLLPGETEAVSFDKLAVGTAGTKRDTGRQVLEDGCSPGTEWV